MAEVGTTPDAGARPREDIKLLGLLPLLPCLGKKARYIGEFLFTVSGKRWVIVLLEGKSPPTNAQRSLSK